jgi:putative flippase GtrA
VGGSSTLVTLVIYTAAIALGVWYPLAAFVGYAAGILNGYTWNRIWTFQTGPFHLPEFSRYVVIQGSGLLANVFGVLIAVETLGMGKLPAELATLVPIVLVTFFANRRWTFRPRPGPEST